MQQNSDIEGAPGRAVLGEALRFAFMRKGLTLGTVGLAIIALLAIFSPFLSPHDPYAQDILSRRLPPIWDAWFNDSSKALGAHPLGTDNLGRDYWARLVEGARVSLIVGFAGALCAVLIGSVIGITAGYYGGRVDLAANFVIQTRLSLPVILMAMLAVATFGGSLALIVVLCGVFLWEHAAVVSRAVTRQMVGREFVIAAKALGASDFRIILTEIAPNVLKPLAVVLSIEMGNAILLEAALSFLGLGMPPPVPSWGLMLSEAKDDIFFSPWTIMMPGFALFLLVLCTNLVGDGLQGDRRRTAS